MSNLYISQHGVIIIIYDGNISYRQHLSYDGCLRIRGEIIRTVLCCIVY